MLDPVRSDAALFAPLLGLLADEALVLAGRSRDGSDGTRTRDLRRDRCDETVASAFA